MRQATKGEGGTQRLGLASCLSVFDVPRQLKPRVVERNPLPCGRGLKTTNWVATNADDDTRVENVPATISLMMNLLALVNTSES